MALVTTTLSSAVAVNDNSIVVASATSISAGRVLRIDDEYMIVGQSYTTGTTVPVQRGYQSAVLAHKSSANVTHGSAVDFSVPPAGLGLSVTLPASRARAYRSYVAAGAIELPIAGSDMVAALIGTSTIAMTIAAPSKDLDGCLLYVVGQAKSASTLTVNDGTDGIGNAGSGYDVLTAQNAGNIAIQFIACNGFWCLVGAPLTGTSTALSWAIA